MKPVHLKLAGLQSYREPQEIDFTVLCETGLFGIFGPTGSGKSTVLDAITLAMYGKVERATNGTQGIMNISENQLAVSFTFELLAAAGPKRYRVERRFKRVNEVSVSNTVSRFVEISEEGEIVLADKLADVTRCVEDIIGLTITDFTRAVVLPQGKFAEFLALKGSERRQMLQRLFHLEKYGDELNIKLSRRSKETDVLLKEIAAEQQGLGDASESALQEAEKALETARQYAEEQRAKRKEAEAQHERQKQIREWLTEREGLLSRQLSLQHSDEEIQQLEQLLKRSELAQRLLPFVTEYEQSVRMASDRKAQAEIAHVSQQTAQHKAAEAVEAWEKIQQELSEQEPKLLVRLDHLEQARTLEQECEQLKRETEGLHARQQQTQSNHALLTEQYAHLKQQADKAVKRQAELKEALKLHEVRPEWRDQVFRADRLRQTLQSIERQHAQAKAELDATVAELTRLESSVALQREAEQQVQAQILEWLTDGQMLLGQLQSDQSLLEQLHETLVHEATRVRQLQREAELKHISVRLAEQLVQGDPCPVCGSTSHPQVQVDGDESAIHVPKESDISEELVKISQLTDKVNDLRVQYRHLILRYETIQQSIASDISDQPGWSEAAAAHSLSEPLNLEPEMSDRAIGTTIFEPIASIIERLQLDESSRDHKLQEMEQFVKQLRTRMTELHRQSAALAADQHAKTQQRHQQERSVATLSAEMKLIQDQWLHELPQIRVEQLDDMLVDIKSKEEKLLDIQERLERSVPFIEETNDKLTRNQQQLNEADKDMVLLSAQLEGKQQLMQEKQARLLQWVGEQGSAISVSDIIQTIQETLRALRSKYQTIKTVYDQTQQVLQHATQEAATAKQASLSAEERAAQAALVWEEQRQNTMFLKASEVRAACMSEEDTRRHTEKIQSHRELQQKLVVQMQKLDEQLNGQTLTEEAWQACGQNLQMLLQQDEEAVRSKAKAERDAEDLKRKAERWSVLEQNRVIQQLQLERLSQLQAVFRGNTFVEFIAEEQLMQVSRAASDRLSFLTKQRYALEVDSTGGFVIRDNANGGVRRPVSTLSGGETFLTSLALALALSAQIQLQGKYPLQFFFLDEGFGTLDPELLDTVITALEKLHLDQLTVGIISHVPELRARLARKLVVTPAQQSGEGSVIAIETL